MPAQRPVLGVARLAIVGTRNSIPWVNIFHVRHDPAETPWSTPTIQALATAVRGFYVARFVPLLATDVITGDLTAVDLSSDFGAAGAATGTTAGGGGVSSQANSVAACITWRIARRYRGGHPRTYLPTPGGSSAVSTGHTWGATVQTGVATAAEAFRTDIVAGDYAGVGGELCCVHRVKDGATLNTPLVDVIFGSAFDTRVDVQRRRLGRDR